MKNNYRLQLSASVLFLVIGAAASHAQVALPVQDPLFATPTGISNGAEDLLDTSGSSAPYKDADFFTVGVANPDSEEFTGGTGNDLTNNPLPGAAAGGAFNALQFDSFGKEELATYSGGNLGNFVAGQTYSLTVAIGDGLSDSTSHEVGGLYTIDLLENGSEVATSSSTAEVNNFTDLTLTFTAGAGDTGAIGFDIGLTGASANGDGETIGYVTNVQLDNITATPEPSSVALSLIAGGLLVAMGVRRHRASKA